MGGLSTKTGFWEWDRVAGQYWAKPSQDVYYLVDRWGESKRDRILDLGSGLGRHSILLAKHGFDVTAMDSSPSGLRSLTHVVKEDGLSIRTVRGDLTSLPFADGSFDAVLAYHSIYHVDSRGIHSAIAELRRVVASSGEVYLTLNSKNSPTYADPNSAVVDDNVRMKREEDGSILPHYYCDLEDLKRLLKEFRIITLRQVEDIFENATGWHYFVLAAVQ